jgi:sugar phosphate isomerase/epimerase
LDRIASYADEKGITIVVEPTAAATNLIETADDAMELMRSAARDNVKVMANCASIHTSEIFLTTQMTSFRH